MTRDQIIQLARDAGVSIRSYYDETGSTPEELKRFEALVRADERGACAKVCDAADKSTHPAGLADAIRARKDNT
jgi:hypothetical protein